MEKAAIRVSTYDQPEVGSMRDPESRLAAEARISESNPLANVS